MSVYLLAVGWNASLVCSCMSCKCQERCHHVSSVRSRDSAGNRNQ